MPRNPAQPTYSCPYCQGDVSRQPFSLSKIGWQIPPIAQDTYQETELVSCAHCHRRWRVVHRKDLLVGGMNTTWEPLEP